jgi:hypothetical protein
MKRQKTASTARRFDAKFSEQPCHQYFARLMSPKEVAQATAVQPLQVQQVTAGHWSLCGDVSTPMFNLLREVPAANFPMRLTGFSSSGGYGYCVITQQVQQYQHRFVLCLYDPIVRHFIQSLSNADKLLLSLGNDDGIEALLLVNPLTSGEFLPLLAMSLEADLKGQIEALQELPLVVERIGNPLAVPSMVPGQVVKNVCVSFLLPEFVEKTAQNALQTLVRQ